MIYENLYIKLIEIIYKKIKECVTYACYIVNTYASLIHSCHIVIYMLSKHLQLEEKEEKYYRVRVFVFYIILKN